MSSFWKNAYNDEKDRRYGTLFFVTLLLVLGTVFTAAILTVGANSYEMRDFCEVALPVIILTIILVCWRWIRAECQYHKARLKYAALSRDELAKARSKLKSQMSQMKPARLRKQMRFGEKRPLHRPPDTNLKY